jgi:glucans biosynthesis protein
METRWCYLWLFQLVMSSVLAAGAFDFDQVREQARALSQHPYTPSTSSIPESLQKLNYDQYQSIHFDRRFGLWSGLGLPFQIDFFLPGSIHKQVVRVSEVTGQEVRRIAFQPEAFRSGTNQMDLPPDLSYAGFRILEPRRAFHEVGSFLDASYFRMAGRGETFGASARGLAVNTALLNHEEFPAFTGFWLRTPEPDDETLTIWALLDSPSVTGAFEFVIRPGVDTVSRVRTTFFPRKPVQELGLAPLSSMFFYDENSHPPKADYRPQVHDSDGLLLETGQEEWIWRPLNPGKAVQINAYQDLNPKGFGLLQRDQDFADYQDLVARYELRPSVWVVPLSNWGPGHVELIQLPTDSEYMDNIVAFWKPANQTTPGQAVDLAYAIHWLTNRVEPGGLAWVRATRIGRVQKAPAGKQPAVRFVVEFAGPGLDTAASDAALEAEAHCGEGAELVTHNLVRNEVAGTWRLVLEISQPTKVVDLSAKLTRNRQPVSETWTYTWQP